MTAFLNHRSSMNNRYHHWKYAHDSINVSRLLFERSFRGNGRTIQYGLQSHGSLMERLSCEAILKGHEGCVNQVTWNQNGSLLATGSDDTKVIIWDYATHKQQEIIHTGHSLNIFGVCFVPGTNDHLIASAGMDCEVRLHYLPFHQEDSTKLYRFHKGRVKDLSCSHHIPKVFWSVAEDGIVYQFDVRSLPNCNGVESDASGVLIQLGKDERGRTIRGMGMSVHPLDPTKVVLACGDHYTRLYDRRMLRLKSLSSDKDATIPVQIFAPPHLHVDTLCESLRRRRHRSCHGTSIQFSSDGTEILANYHNDHIYLFPVNSNSTNKQKVLETASQWKYQKYGMTMDFPLGYAQLKPLTTQEMQILHTEAKTHFIDREFTKAIQQFTRICTTLLASNNTANTSPSFCKTVYCDLARTLLARGWQADTFLACLFCKEALTCVPDDRDVLLTYIRALHASKRLQLCKLWALEYQVKFPAYASQVEEFTKYKGDTPIYTMSMKRRRRSSSEQDEEGNEEQEQEEDGQANHVSLRERWTRTSGQENQDQEEDEEQEESDSEEDNESDSDSEIESELSPINNTNTKINSLEEEENFWENPLLNEKHQVNVDVLHRYIGYCNVQTDIKEATFFGLNDQYIVAGSDDGHALFWEKATGKLVNAIEADEDIVNCVQAHPIDACLATSGIENVVRLWSPVAEESQCPEEETLEHFIDSNQKQMSDISRNFIQADHPLIRMIMRHGEEGEIVPECTQS